MTYDREEWRLPWPAPVRPASAPTVVPPTDPTPPPGAGSTAASLPEPDPELADPYEPTDTEPTEPEPDPTEELGAPAAVPIERHPQPPPESWDEASAGPGSPAGSVRPPDTTGTVDAPERPRRGRGVLAVALAALLGAVLGTVLTLAFLELRADRETDEGTAPPTEEAPDDEAQDEAAPVPMTVEATSVVPAVAEAVTPSVVRVDIPLEEGGDSALGARASLGSGVIYRADGYILTNEHVVRGSDRVRVRLSDGELLDAEVVGRDELNDLAVVRVEATGLPAITFRDPEREPIVVGETVVAIGSPFGLDASVTTGIVSALNREIDLPDDPEAGGRLVIPSLIQTDAAINPGNSGGALVDTQGRLIGINTAILSATGANQGVGFAVNVRQALVSADQLIEQGFVRHPLLGVGGKDVDPRIADQLGLDSARGAVIENVQEDTGAAEAELRPGDVIVGVDGEPIATMSQLVAEVRGRQPGDEVELAIIRGGDELTVTVVLSERPRSDGG